MVNKNYDNCFLTSIVANVKDVDKLNNMYWYTFDNTIFYVESGGMSSDEGLIDNNKVLGLKVDELGNIWHLLDKELNGSVRMSVNPHIRFRNAQIHTAQHLISYLVKSIYKCNILSRYVSEEENYIEFELKDLKDRFLSELEVTANGLIRDDLKVKISYPSLAEIYKHIPKEEVKNKNRIVSIGDLDYNPCGCIHVPSTRYLQSIKIIGSENSARGIKIKYIVGDQLLDCVNKRYKVLNESSNILALSHLYINVGINNLINQKKELLAEVESYKKKYFNELINELDKSEDIIVHEFDNLDIKDLHLLANMYYEDNTKTILFYSYNRNNLLLVLGDTSETLNCNKVIRDMSKEYDISGGGNESIAQANCTNVSIEEIKKYIFDKLI